jgi:hypothetical protein
MDDAASRGRPSAQIKTTLNPASPAMGQTLPTVFAPRCLYDLNPLESRHFSTNISEGWSFSVTEEYDHAR